MKEAECISCFYDEKKNYRTKGLCAKHWKISQGKEHPCPYCGSTNTEFAYTEPDYGDGWQCLDCREFFAGYGGKILDHHRSKIFRFPWEEEIKSLCPECLRFKEGKCTEITIDINSYPRCFLKRESFDESS